MNNAETWDCPCDVCGSTDAVEIPEARLYTDGQPIHVCKDCGFIYVRRRRSAEDIARSWSDELFGGADTARIPAVAARQTYVAEYLDDAIDPHGKSVCDIGGGEGLFGELLQRPPYGARVFAVEPSESNCAQMTERGIENFCGTIEEYTSLPGGRPPAIRRGDDLVDAGKLSGLRRNADGRQRRPGRGRAYRRGDR